MGMVTDKAVHKFPQVSLRFTLVSFSALLQKGVLVAPADTAGRVEEPVHEDSRAVVVWIVGKQAVPLVLLLTSTVPTAPARCGFRANFLVDRLFKLLAVHYCSNLSIAITRPVGRHNFNFRLAHILLFRIGILVWRARKVCLPSDSLAH